MRRASRTTEAFIPRCKSRRACQKTRPFDQPANRLSFDSRLGNGMVYASRGAVDEPRLAGFTHFWVIKKLQGETHD
jgi:hypothetical protein